MRSPSSIGRVDAVAHRIEQRQRRGIAATRARDERGARSAPSRSRPRPARESPARPTAASRCGCAQHPVARRVDQPLARHDLIDRAAGQRFGRPQAAAFEHQRERRLDADQPRQALRAAAGRQQADRHLDQADERLVVVDQHAVAAAQRQLVAAAERHAVDRRGDRLAAALDAAQVDVPAVADLEGLALAHAAVVRADEVLDVAAGDEAAGLARRDDRRPGCGRRSRRDRAPPSGRPSARAT